MRWKTSTAVAHAAAVAACSIALLAGCGSSSKSAGSAKAATIAFVPGDLKDDFWITMKCGVQAAAHAAGASVSTQAPSDGTAVTQKPLIDSIVASKPDILVVSPDDSKAMQEPLAVAAAGGIKVVLVNNTTVDPSYAATQIASDDLVGGRDAFEAIKQLVPSGGKVLVIGTQPGFANTDARVTGFKAAAAADPSFKYLGVQYSMNSVTTAAQIVTAALQKNPDIVGIFAVNESSATGAATGLRQAGKQGQVKLVGYDAGPIQITQLKQNSVQALIAQHPSGIGEEGVKEGIAALKGQAVPKKIATSLTTITRANVNTVGTTAAYKSSC
jgi:ribose transport system substrate-binding protein